jgi:hypothetical protein
MSLDFDEVILQLGIIVHCLKRNLEYLNESTISEIQFSILNKDSDIDSLEVFCWKLGAVILYQALKCVHNCKYCIRVGRSSSQAPFYIRRSFDVTDLTSEQVFALWPIKEYLAPKRIDTWSLSFSAGYGFESRLGRWTFLHFFNLPKPFSRSMLLGLTHL